MSEFSQGFRPLSAALIGTMCGAMAITTYSQGFFVGPVTSEFGWSYGQFFLGFTLMSLLGLIAAPLTGSLAQKYGIRKLGMLGLIGHAIGYIGLSYNPNSLPLWYLTWGLISFIAAGSLPIIWTAVLNGWFIKHRGKALGLTMAGTGISAFILAPLCEFLISNYGWRYAYRAIGIGAMIMSLPVVYFWFHSKPQSEAQTDANLGNEENWGYTRKQALRTKTYWLMSAALFLIVFVVIGMLSNFEPILNQRGASGENIAIFGAVIGVMVIVGRLLAGALIDRFWAPAVGCVFFFILLMSLLALLYIPFSFAIGLFLAIAVGLASGAELDLLAYLTSKYFGPKNYSEIFGGIFAVFAVGGGLAPPIFGQLAENTGSYDLPIMIGIGFLVLLMPLFLMLGKYPDNKIVAN